MSASSGTAALARPASLTMNLERTSADYNEAAAFAEGWGVFNCGNRDDGSRRIELQRLDNPPSGAPSFHGDEHAWRPVFAQSAAGSPLHIAALAALDPIERLAIEAACVWCPGL